MEYYAVLKKNVITSFDATSMQLETIILRELKQKQKNKLYTYSLLNGSQTKATCEHKDKNKRHWGLLDGGGEEEGKD